MKSEAIKRTQENFDMLLDRLINLKEVNIKALSDIKGCCLCIGSGGSQAASYFASKVLERKNGIVTICEEPRNVIYRRNLHLFKHILAVTYSNSNHGISEAVRHADQNGIKSYVLTASSKSSLNSSMITYSDGKEKERSFISIASTFEPMMVMLKYYMGCELNDLIKDVYNEASIIQPVSVDATTTIEIMTGDDTYTAAKILESTITEAGLGTPVVHEKYNYCHGRSTVSHNTGNSVLVYLINKKTEIDEILLNTASDSYKTILLLKSNYQDSLVGEFDLAVQSMFLCKLIAESQNKGLSKVDYNPVVKKLYHYGGKM